MNKGLNEICKMKKEVISIDPEATIQKAVESMNKEKIGALIVMKGECISGIVTERDVLYKLANTDINEDIHDVKINTIMTPFKKLIVGHADDTLEYLMKVMTEKHIRHIPIVDKKCKLVCLASIRDIVRFLLKDTEMTVKYLSDYVQGNYPG